MLTLLHMPAGGARPETGVLICPPFGWEDICSYRSRWQWAEQLADAGRAAMRIDLPGTGDSGGSWESAGLLATWREAAGGAAAWLRETAGCARVVAVGIGLGGVVSCLAAAAAADGGAVIDELVLWGVPSRGRHLTRELSAFAMLEAGRDGLARAAELQVPGAICAGGFVLGAETVTDLGAIDLTGHDVAAGGVKRALLLTRDGMQADARLRASMEQSGVAVTVAEGPGFGAMMAEPHFATPPTEVFATVERWLQDGQGADAAPREPRSTTTRHKPAFTVADEAALAHDGASICERPLYIGQEFGDMFGILASPAEGPSAGIGAVLLNAGAIRRVGPNRMWVEIARRWAARGVPSLRVDLESLGDSDGSAAIDADVAQLYGGEALGQVRAALDELERQEGVTRFVLVGLCSGAYWSFHGALYDERVAAALMLNARTLFYDPLTEPMRDLRKGLSRRDALRKLARGEVRASRMRAIATRAPRAIFKRAFERRPDPDGDKVAHAFDSVRDKRQRLLFGFCEIEDLYQEFQRERRFSDPARWPNIRVELLPGDDHTLRPLEAQRDAQKLLDAALEAEIRLLDDGESRAPTVYGTRAAAQPRA